MEYFAADAPAALRGGYNRHGKVSGEDYTVWRDSFGDVGVGRPADGNSNGELDAPGCNISWGNFRDTLGAYEPEPSTLTLPKLAVICAKTRSTAG